MVFHKDLYPQQFLLLSKQTEFDMLGLARPKDHRPYQCGDTIVFHEFFGTPGPWGTAYGKGRKKIAKIIHIEHAEDAIDQRTNKHYKQVRLFMKLCEQ